MWGLGNRVYVGLIGLTPIVAVLVVFGIHEMPGATYLTWIATAVSVLMPALFAAVLIESQISLIWDVSFGFPQATRWTWTWITVLAVASFIGLVMPFLLGAKGNRWAWRKRRWNNVASFRRIQRLWGGAGLVVTILALAGLGLGGYFAESEGLGRQGETATLDYGRGQFTSSEYGISFSYPLGWKPADLGIIDEQGMTVLVELTDDNRNQLVVFAFDSSNTQDSGVAAEQFMSNLIADAESRNRNVVDRSSVSVDGHEAWGFRSVDTAGVENFLVIEGDPFVFGIMCAGEGTTRAVVEALEETAASIEFSAP